MKVPTGKGWDHIRTVVGAILAGGAARRLGGEKAAREVGDRPLAAYPAEALASVAAVVALVGKHGGDLPALPGVELWDGEPPEPRHPAVGIAYALERAGDAVLVCAADMPFVGARECRALVEAAGGTGAPFARAAVADAGGDLEPLLGVYPQGARDELHRGALQGRPMRVLAAELDPIRVELPERALQSINTPEQLAAAERELRQPRSST